MPAAIWAGAEVSSAKASGSVAPDRHYQNTDEAADQDIEQRPPTAAPRSLVQVIDASGLTEHNEVVAMLKADHGLAHGAAHRLSLLARQRPAAGAAAPADPADRLYADTKAGLRPLHNALLGEIRTLGTFDIAPKKGYLSLRRRKQFAMVQPSTTSRIDLGLILPATTPAAGRLESAARFNPLFTHRVRITAVTDLDDEPRGWLATAYALAG